jgi:signal transduction histidine kinase/DNA-binding response OmpR family regulator/type II secretory pathway pseudopilin PulG
VLKHIRAAGGYDAECGRLGRGIPSRLVVLALVAVIVIPGVVFAAFLLQRFAQAERGRYEQEAREVARTAASVLDLHLQGWQTTLQTLGTSENLRTGNLEAFYRQAMAVKEFVGADVGLRTPDGAQVLNTRVPFGQPVPPTRIGTDLEALSRQSTFVSNVVVGAVSNRPVVAMVVPVVIDGTTRYLLHVSAETNVVNEVLNDAVPQNWLVGVGDRAGVYVTRSQDHDAFTGKPGAPAFLEKAAGPSGSFAGKSAGGEDVVVGYVKSDVSGWLVAASIKQSVIEQPLRSALATLGAFGAAALVFSTLIALWLWRLIDRPLIALTRASSRIGQLDGPIVAKTGLREFAALRDALSSASEQIKADSAALEARVEARTSELAQANLQLTAEIEQRAKVEAMLTQAQKMEAIGNLTGGVAHDFNNLLQVIGGNLQLLGRDVAGNAKAERRVENAMAGVARGSHLAAQLLAFGRRQPLQPKVVNIGRLIRSMDDLLRRSLGEAIEVETIITGGLWNTLVDPTNVENAILNLAINSRDAMDGQGHLTIEAGNAFLDDAYAASHADVVAGQYVQVSVTDTGSGMTREVLDQVFEPFFSTKPEGKGTGLGLSMVYGFVKQSGGHVKVYSEPGQGTTIKLYLPRSTQAEDMPVESDSGPIVGGSETVLVVEDDDAVRETVIALLGELGYHVLKAPDAQSALTVIESGVAIDLLFTDVVMPGALRSPELARKAKERLPGLSVLFTSGYTENAIVHGGRLDVGVNLLSKPYTREQLARKIRQVLTLDGKLPSQNSQPQTGDGQPQPNPDSQAQTQAASTGKSGLTVLVCEDDAIIRMDTADMLQDLGHITIEAENGQTAFDIASSRQIDILLTDVGLPDISGTELARRIRVLKPDLAIIFATGREQVEGFDNAARTALLKKPYQFDQLERIVGSILDDHVSGS